jgi:hypothetical protein
MRQSFGVILTFVRHSSTKWFPFDTHEMVKQLQDAGSFAVIVDFLL